jgi:hypothetical protein
MKITIPTGEQLADHLAGLDRLLLAKGWERSAIVWAFTVGDGQGSRSDFAQNCAKFPVSIREFARLGFAGLKSDNTVRHYREQWQAAIDDGLAQPAQPGETVELPDRPWPPQPLANQGRVTEDQAESIRVAAEEIGAGASSAVKVASSPNAMKAAIIGDDRAAKAAREALHQRAVNEVNQRATDPEYQRRRAEIDAERATDPGQRELYQGGDLAHLKHNISKMTLLVKEAEALARRLDDATEGQREQVRYLLDRHQDAYRYLIDWARGEAKGWDDALAELVEGEGA